MNGYTMALPQHHPLPTTLFPVTCGPRVVFGNAIVPECGDHSQPPPTYMSPKRIKQESEHNRSYPSSPCTSMTATDYHLHQGRDSFEGCTSPPRASRKLPADREVGLASLSSTKSDIARISKHNNNNSNNNNNINNNNSNIHNNNNINNNRNDKNNSKSPAKFPEGVSDDTTTCSRVKGHMQHLDANSLVDFPFSREDDCKPSHITERVNAKEEDIERDEAMNYESIKPHDATNVSMTTFNHHRVMVSGNAPVSQSISSSPSPSNSHSSITVLHPKFSLSSPLSSSASTIPMSSQHLLASPSTSPFSSDIIKPEERQDEEVWCKTPSTNSSEQINIKVEETEDGRNSRLSCIVDIETDTPPTSPVASPSPSHSPLNLSKSCLESSSTLGSDADNQSETPGQVFVDAQRATNEKCRSASPGGGHQSPRDTTSEGQSEDDEETKRRRKTNFSIDAILSSNFGATNSPTDHTDCCKEEEEEQQGYEKGRHHGCLSNDRVNHPTIIHSENSAFSAVDLSVKAAFNSTSSLSPSSNGTSTPPSPRSLSSPRARSPSDGYRSSITAEDENFNNNNNNKITNNDRIGRHPHPYSHLFKPTHHSPRDSTRSMEDVFNEGKNTSLNVNNVTHPFQRFFPAMLPSHFPVPKHGGSATAEMEEFFHRNFPFINQAYSHIVGKFPFVYLPPEQSFPLHNMSKMHPDQNPLFDPTRNLAIPQNNAINPDRSPALPGNSPRFYANFPNAKEFTENINPKPNQCLMNSLYNANNNNNNNSCHNNTNSNNISGSLRKPALHHARSQLTTNGIRNNGSILPRVPNLQMDSKPDVSHSKSKEPAIRKSFSKASPTLDAKSDTTLENKDDMFDDVNNLKSDPANQSEDEDSPDKETSEAEKDANTLWPAWVFCTRYSDRPSSGPRSRKPKRKASVDEKRPRTAFTNDQLQRLKREFDDCRYLTETRRRNLAGELGLSESQIKIWFQNKRAKIKKSMGVKNSLALKLMEEGLYNHTTVKTDDES